MSEPTRLHRQPNQQPRITKRDRDRLRKAADGFLDGMSAPVNPLPWVNDVRTRCKNGICNTGIGKHLGVALELVESQYAALLQLHKDLAAAQRELDFLYEQQAGEDL